VHRTRKLLLGAFCIGVLLLAAPATQAAIIFEASPIGALVAQDSTFNITFTADVTGGDTLYRYGFDLAVSGVAPWVFEVTGRNTAGSPFSDVLPGSPTWPDPLDPQTSNVQFSGGVPLGDPAVSGDNLFLSSFTIHVLPSATAASYTISAVNWYLIEGDATVHSGDTGPGTFVIINPVPEPGSLALLLLAAPSALLLRRRRS